MTNVDTFKVGISVKVLAMLNKLGKFGEQILRVKKGHSEIALSNYTMRVSASSVLERQRVELEIKREDEEIARRTANRDRLAESIEPRSRNRPRRH